MDVVLVRRQGRFSGEAFVLLPGMMQCEFAMNKHKAYMGKRYVEVQQSCREVWSTLNALSWFSMHDFSGVCCSVYWVLP